MAPGAELAWSEAPPLFLPVSSRGRGGAQAEAVVSPGHTLDGSQSRVRARQRSWGPAQAWAVGTPVGSHHPPPMGSPIPPWDLPCTRGPGQGGDVLSAHRGPAAGAGGWNPRLHWPGAVNAATPSASTSVSQRRSSSRGRGGRAGGARGGRGGAGRGGGGGRGAERGGRDGSSRGRGEQHSTGMRREEQAEREAGFWRAEGRPEPEPHARAREVAQGRGRGEDSAGVPLQSPTTSSSSPSPSRSSREGIIARVAREQGARLPSASHHSPLPTTYHFLATSSPALPRPSPPSWLAHPLAWGLPGSCLGAARGSLGSPAGVLSPRSLGAECHGRG